MLSERWDGASLAKLGPRRNTPTHRKPHKYRLFGHCRILRATTIRTPPPQPLSCGCCSRESLREDRARESQVSVPATLPSCRRSRLAFKARPSLRVWNPSLYRLTCEECGGGVGRFALHRARFGGRQPRHGGREASGSAVTSGGIQSKSKI